ncbi:hypothetical protein DH2020_009741 [Rehmannia glutinosa]|uniref:DUF8040 domain-containing protein n=1 Tax=Rehmannia glutinosa TaxID=99300 RepID=A0ABR0X862_REHGL
MSEISRRRALLVEEIMLESVFIMNMFVTKIRMRARRRLRNRKQGITYDMASRIPKQIEHLDDLILRNDVGCLDNLRMTRGVFAKLCYLLKHVGGLVDSRYVSVNEKATLFLSVLAHHKKNWIVRFDFKRSGQTVSRHFHDVLNVVFRLHTSLLVSPQPVDDNCTNPRWSSFKEYEFYYGSLVTMLSHSGIGWNDNTKMIEAPDSEWAEYVKVNSNARLMRNKSWPFYNDWVVIFGKDGAAGEHAEDFIEAVNHASDVTICMHDSGGQ